MTRKEFLRTLATLGIAAPLVTTLAASCNEKDETLQGLDVDYKGKVLIIGAGAAGMTAGYLLNRFGVDFQIIEASAVFGGRIKRLDGFADFPIDLGGEWIHTDPAVLSRMLDDSAQQAKVDLVTYNPQTVSVWRNGKLRKRNITRHFYSEYKFKSTTWYGFFERFIVPSIQDRIIYNSPVRSIDYSSDRVVVKDRNDNTYEADKVLVTVPVSILKNSDITFEPALPTEKVEALDSIYFPPILKAFFEFSERFYPDLLVMDNLLTRNEMFYDAAFRKEAKSHVLGLFVIDDPAQTYVDLGTDQAIIQSALAKLDEVFDGKASQFYVKGAVQNWTTEPFIQGSYSHFEENISNTIRTLIEPLNDKVYFAGEAMNLNGDTSTVHGASESAYLMIRRMLQL